MKRWGRRRSIYWCWCCCIFVCLYVCMCVCVCVQSIVVYMYYLLCSTMTFGVMRKVTMNGQNEWRAREDEGVEQ